MVLWTNVIPLIFLTATIQFLNLMAIFKTQLEQAFLLQTKITFYVAVSGLSDLKRAAVNTLSAIQKIGRTTKNR